MQRVPEVRNLPWCCDKGPDCPESIYHWVNDNYWCQAPGVLEGVAKLLPTPPYYVCLQMAQSQTEMVAIAL